MRDVYSMAQRFARTNVPVLIFGETGTGKELVAGTVHRQSGRTGRLRAINCASIPSTLVETTLFGHERGAFTGALAQSRGVFEEADGGTVFLDELGELSPSAQASLLRVLETGAFTRVGGTRVVCVDVRVVAATHRDLEVMAREGAFRRDLLFRLNTVMIRVPALRHRKEEIAPLVQHFLEAASQRFAVPTKTVSSEALRRLESYQWPGNVRELRNVIERAVLLSGGPLVRPEDLPEKVRGQQRVEVTGPVAEDDLPHRERLKQYEIRLIRDALQRAEGNQSLAAKLLKMPLRTLVHKIGTYDLKERRDSD
jgi:DNA-binding NtrC family response regulator